jgi:hypothetical protein
MRDSEKEVLLIVKGAFIIACRMMEISELNISGLELALGILSCFLYAFTSFIRSCVYGNTVRILYGIGYIRL